MAEKQYRIIITYNDDSTEEYVIHSDETVEWITQQKLKTVPAFLSLFSNTNQVAQWFKNNDAKKLVVKDEPEI